jgi:hypothetical protein
MRTITCTLYKFDDLPTDEAKEKAREWWRNGLEFAWNSESLDSIKTFCAHFGVTLKDWTAGPYSSPEYRTDAENQHFRGRRLRDFNRDHMPTGYCLDCDLWMTFYDRFKATGDAKGAFDEALWAGFKAWRDDMEWQLSDEYIDECLTINEYEFDEEGRLA